MEFLDWLLLGIFFAIIIPLGLSYRKFSAKGMDAYFLGGRNLPWWLAGISMVATTFAADTPLAVTELVSSGGISANWLWWNFLMGGMLTTFFFANLWRRANVLTEVELIELRYGGKPAAWLRGFKAFYLGFFLNILIIGWVNLAMISILEVFFDLTKMQAIMGTGLLMLTTAFYVVFSGLKGIAVTDAVQFVVAMSAAIILAVLVVHSPEIGGIDGLKSSLNEVSPGALTFFPQIDWGNNLETANVLTVTFGTFLAYIGFQWWASWYPGAEPGGGGYVAQRMMSAKNEKHAVWATLFFQVAHYCIRPWPWIIVGLCVLILYPDLTPETQREGYVMAILDYMPVGLKGLMLAAFIAAYMSTISTQLNWGSSYLVNDFYKRFINVNADDKKDILISRIVILLLMVVALTITLFMDSISGVWVFLIETGAGLGLVLILRWYWWRINVWSEFTATITPFFVLAGLKITQFFYFKSFSAAQPGLENDALTEAFFQTYPMLTFPGSFFLILSITTISWLVVTFLTAPEPEHVLNKFYKKVKPDGWWKPVSGISNGRQSKNLIGLLVSWISAVGLTYMILFTTGKIIFGEWTQVMIFSGFGLLCFIVLKMALKNVHIFK